MYDHRPNTSTNTLEKIGKAFIFVGIFVYQFFLHPLLSSILGTNRFCRYTPSCSLYAKQQIIHHGIWKGSMLATKRFLSCHPFGTIGGNKHA